MMQRRTFLQGTGLALAAGWVRVPTARAEGGHLIELSSRPPNYESVRATFTQRITPIDRLYIRNHFDMPAADPKTWKSTWKLAVRGLVGKPVELTIADLEKLPQTTVEAVIQCAGNGRGLFRPRVAGVQWRWGAMGNCEWTGVRLADVLAAAGVKAEARYLHLRGADKPSIDKTPPFVRAIPIAKAMHRDTLLALRMNGRSLAPLHGYPVRLVVPGWVADDWIKWVVDLELSADEPKAFFYDTAYRFPVTPGKPGQPIPPAQTQPMTKLNVKSLIGSISEGDAIAPGKRELVGVAFSGEARIAKVDITLDGGASWQAAALDAHDSDYGFRVFRYPFDARPGVLRIASRATDATGAIQPADPVWNPSGYLFNAIEYVRVEVRG